ncbi:MAG: sigma-54-dependent Fis family transcriptional regulator, partial [Candidatus Omnitrophica bacterium]|nr:sigma-54-dependent Fis family transcriptional regulator [Candidatus Omnitrophota bacterium]
MNKNKYILVVDDEPLTRKSLCEILRIEGYKVNQASDGEEALELIKKSRPEIIVTDLKMPKVDGLTLLREVKLKYPDIAVVLSTGYGSIETAVTAMKEGAFDYVTKPIIDNEIKIIIQRIYNQKLIIDENIELKQKLALNNRTTFHKIIGQNQGMQRIYNLIESVAPTNATILIQGESGTGKRLIAHALHHSDANRKDKPFVEVSCGALPENLLESELFGHVKGSFTSAVKDRKGRFEIANGGTIFLDEIDAFSPQLQVKLLKVLQEGDFERVGDSETLHVDVRVIAATNQNLKKLIEQKLFREDLYYRLHVIPIDVPPLRERKDDISLLVEYFLEEFSKKIKNKKFNKISEEAKNILF